MIHDLLVPTDEARNEHKRLQLRELAALNGARSWAPYVRHRVLRCAGFASLAPSHRSRSFFVRMGEQNWKLRLWLSRLAPAHVHCRRPFRSA